MTRSRDFSKILGRSVTNDTFTATGAITPLSVTSYDYDSAGQLQALNNSSLVDGSLHYLSKTKQLYVWDDSDNSYYPIDQSASALTLPYSFQGTVSGYTSGGRGSPAGTNFIDKFPFSSDANATDVGDLTVARYGLAGQSSETNGYASGGVEPPTTRYNVIDKFPFSVDANASDVGDLTVARRELIGQSSETNGYASGGVSPPATMQNVIDKFSFSADGNATDVGNLTVARYGPAGQSSDASGYASGGITPSGTLNVIEKFPFSADADATDVGDLTVVRSLPAGLSSSVSGYTSGGQTPGPSATGITNIIDKFPFSSDANASDVGDLTVGKKDVAGQSSTVSGYTSGAQNPNLSPAWLDIIDKFPFSTDANATDVGDLTVGRQVSAGQQV